MTDDLIRAFLNVENIGFSGALSTPTGHKEILISINPDLTSDFGHFLNYERRIQKHCQDAKIDYRCFANCQLTVEDEGLLRVFEQDSGYYSLTRRGTVKHNEKIAEQFFDVVTTHIEQIEQDKRYDTIWLFLYCGSSLLASLLCDKPWDSRVRLCINAFWDFLLPKVAQRYNHVARLPFQNSVRLLAMSDLHQSEIIDATGLSLDWIPNPPPLHDDIQAYEEIRAQVGRRAMKNVVQILVPGLMTIGKGKSATIDLFEHVRTQQFAALSFVFRDRSGAFLSQATDSASICSGDLSDTGISELYRGSDFALLPYEPETFRVRTSGALVDCLMFGVVPLVLQDTWLAHICERYDVGLVLPDSDPETIMRIIEDALPSLEVEHQRVFVAAIKYLADQSWDRLFERIFEQEAAVMPSNTVMSMTPEQPLLRVANRLFREGRYVAAARIYHWLSEMSDLAMYRQNLESCTARIGISTEELLRRVI